MNDDKPLTDEERARAGRYPTFPIYRSHPNDIVGWFLDAAQAEAEVERRNRDLIAGEAPWKLNSLGTLREVHAQGRIGAAEVRALLANAPELSPDELARAAMHGVWILWYEDRMDHGETPAMALGYFIDEAVAEAARNKASSPEDPWQSYTVTNSGNLLELYVKGGIPLEQLRRVLTTGSPA